MTEDSPYSIGQNSNRSMSVKSENDSREIFQQNNNNNGNNNGSEGQQSPASGSGTSNPLKKSVTRAMLPRGAACDLCRSRKVKCDGIQPICGQCVKSSKGKTETINCQYEGGASARSGSGKKAAKMAAIAAAALAGGTNNGGGGEGNGLVKVKAPRKSNPKPRGGGVSGSGNGNGNGVPRDYNSAPKPLVSYNDSNERGGDVGGGSEQIDRRLSLNKRPRETSEDEDVIFEDDSRADHKAFDDQPKRKKETNGQRVETLQYRIVELEKKLQQAAPQPIYTQSRPSPSNNNNFYPSPTSYTPPMPNSMDQLNNRRPSTFHQNSLAGGIGGGNILHGNGGSSEEIGSKDMVSNWSSGAAESSVRFNGRGGSLDSHAPTSTNRGNSPPYGSTYASFIPNYDEQHRNSTGGNFGPPVSDFFAQQQQIQQSNQQHNQQSHHLQPPLPPVQTNRQQPQQQHPIPSNSSNHFPGGASYPPLNYAATPYNQHQILSDNQPLFYQNSLAPQPLFNSTALAPSPSDDLLNNGFNSSPGHSPESALSMDAHFLQLLYPSWPLTLPSPTTVNHLVNVFFTRAQVPSAMFNKTRFLISLSLPPGNDDFPNTGLLHAICAYTSIFVSEEILGGGGGTGSSEGSRYWESEKDPRSWHYKRAREEIEIGLMKQGNLFQILQATILCSYIAYQTAAFTDLWFLSGLATRLCTPLGLNHMTPWNFASSASEPATKDWQARIRNTPSVITHSLLAPAKDVEEHYERTATFWAAFSVDRHASAATDWSTSIDEMDIATHLPCLAASTTFLASRSPKDPNFLQSTSKEIGSMGLYIKAVILLGRVINYLQRLPRHQRMPRGENCATMGKMITSTPEFVELDYALSKFRATVSADFFNAGNLVDGHLASAYAIPHAASILLHEIFCNRQDKSDDSALARCLTSAKCVVNSTYVLFSSSNDLSAIDPFLLYCWSVVGRSLVRDFAVKKHWGDMVAATSSFQLAEHVLSFTSSCNSRGQVPVATVMTQALEQLLLNPERTLPPIEVDGETGASEEYYARKGAC